MIKNKNIFAIALFLGLTVLWSGCKKDEPDDCSQPCQHDESFEAMLEWCYFKVGTWWVYEEQNIGIIDSIYVWNDDLNNNSEAFEFWTYSSYHEYDWVYRHFPGQTGDSNESPCQIRRYQRGLINPPIFVSSGFVGNFPVIRDDFSADGNSFSLGVVTTEEVYDSLSINNLQFGETVEFSAENCPSENYKDTHFIIAKNVGIIKKYIPILNEEWHLIDYNIIQ